MFSKRPPAVLFMTVFSVMMLNWGEVRADFGSGTITFEESSYQLYTLTNTNGVATDVTAVSTPLTIADDVVIPTTHYFKVGTDVYVRFGFDSEGGGSAGVGDGVLDASDTPAVIEATYTAGTSLNDGNIIRGSMDNFNDPAADIFAYTSGSGSTEKSDFVASGYEDQAGNYFVRARKDKDGTSTTSNAGNESNKSVDEERWSSFIIEYATTNGATVNAATGEIWDIDGTSSAAEQFDVTATLASNPDLTDTSPLGNNMDLDAKPWAWSFSNTGSSITQIKFTRKSGTNYKTFFPLAFNNFNPISAIGYVTPEPSSLLAFGGIFSLTVLRRRRRSASA